MGCEHVVAVEWTSQACATRLCGTSSTELPAGGCRRDLHRLPGCREPGRRRRRGRRCRGSTTAGSWHAGAAPGEVAQGIVALKSALEELRRWDETLVLTYAEFGRRPKEDLSNGTDHGTANVHFAFGGRVAGGFYGDAPALDRLGADANPGFAIDFRQVYSMVLERWWGLPAGPLLAGRFAPIPFLRG
jgi:hypothetical protein